KQRSGQVLEAEKLKWPPGQLPLRRLIWNCVAWRIGLSDDHLGVRHAVCLNNDRAWWRLSARDERNHAGTAGPMPGWSEPLTGLLRTLLHRLKAAELGSVASSVRIAEQSERTPLHGLNSRRLSAPPMRVRPLLCVGMLLGARLCSFRFP